MTTLIAPYGGRLVDLVVADERERADLAEQAKNLPALRLSARSLCDLELLSTGAFSPLDRFMGRADYERVLAEMRLADSTLFPIPITLPVGDGDDVEPGRAVSLRNDKNELLGVMPVEERYRWDFEAEASRVYGTTDLTHPMLAEMTSWGSWYVSGRPRLIRPVSHPTFTDLRRTPREVRRALEGLGRSHVVAFQTRNPIHRAHEELTKRAAATLDASLLVHPVVGLTRPGDVDAFTRVRCYRALMGRYYDPARTVLSLLPLAMRMAGPREAVWHAIIRRNHGASHFIVGRDHAGPGLDAHGKPFYPPYAAQELLARHAGELGVTSVPFQEMVYLPDEDRYEEVDRVAGARTRSISGTQVRRDYLARGRALPAWFTRPEVARILRESSVPAHRRGFCVWLTGLPCAGKSTVAEILTAALLERGRQVTVLDGDVVRTHLSKGLGFSKEDRDENILRIGFVASEVVRHHGAVIAAAVSPYHAARSRVRRLFPDDSFVLVYVDTPLPVCEERDVKGLYAKARRGELKGFTGVDDPYEPPPDAELVLDGHGVSPADNARRIVDYLIGKGFLPPARRSSRRRPAPRRPA
jgi:sulfate adenylyltransferase